MLRKLVFSLVFIFSVLGYSHSQMATIDVSAIAVAIENGFTMYQQLQNAYNQYQTLIQQLEAQKKQLMSISKDDYDWKQWDASLHMIDDYMTKMDNIEALYNQKSMKIGNTYFSISDLYDRNVYEKIYEDVTKTLNPNNVTLSQKAAFYGRHGLSYDHYMTLHKVCGQLGEVSKDVLAYSQLNKEKNKEEQKVAADTAKTAGELGSAMAVSQQSLKTEALILDATLQSADNTSRLCEYEAQNYARYQSEVTAVSENNENYNNWFKGEGVSQGVINSVGEEKDYRGF